ncbi:hypothetical protein DXG01_002061 [Tephrocybe rancida]|nr:hypothetical protein DXG01_002061 [Tephrocybe rancida]
MITTNVGDVLNKTYDFIIVGGGTAGLVLASRLSANPSTTVAVLEAGENTIDDPMTSIPAPYGRQIGNPKINDSIGGTSTINYLMWSLPPAVDIDAFEKLGNPGWNWDEFHRYSRKIEKFHPPTKEVADRFPHTYGNDRGSSGLLQTTFAPHVHTVDAILKETFANRGIKRLDDPYQGNVNTSIHLLLRDQNKLTRRFKVNGTWNASSTIDPKTWARSSSATAYLVPAQDRPNLTVLTQATVLRVVFAEDRNGDDVTATGVEFAHAGKTYSLSAQKEIILSAGAIKDPQILEMSGIGRRDILSKIGIEPRIELPGVGENFQDHNFVTASYELDPAANHQTLDSLLNPEGAQAAAQLYAQGKGPLRNGIGFFSYFPLLDARSPGDIEVAAKIEKDIEDYKNTPGIVPGLREQLDIQLDTLRSKSSPDIELTCIPMLFSMSLKPEAGKTYVTIFAFNVHPLSRGTIHSKSNDPQDDPEIDPHCFERDSDVDLLVQGIKHIRGITKTEPMKSACVGEELQPGPKCASDEDVREYVKSTNSLSWHGLGTCSMLPREKQGVVDPNLKVYGTKNLRIADLSIAPLQIAAHTQATAYVIGEKASDIILAAYKL